MVEGYFNDDGTPSSYVASSEDGDKNALKNSRIAFSLCYIASHFSLDLVSEEEVAPLLDYIESHDKELKQLIDVANEKHDVTWNNSGNRKAFYEKHCEWDKRKWKAWL